jgi:hypothetical protein
MVRIKTCRLTPTRSSAIRAPGGPSSRLVAPLPGGGRPFSDGELLLPEVCQEPSFARFFGICHCGTSADGPSMSELGIPPSTGGSRARIFPILSHPCESDFAQIADEQLVG